MKSLGFHIVKMSWWFTVGMSFAFALTLSGCEMNDAEKDALKDAFSLNPPPIDQTPIEPAPASCFVNAFRQPEAQITRKLDLLFVTDTSGSLIEERNGIAQGIDAFVAELPPEVDYQIGVMLAHGSLSSYSGKLYQSWKKEPVVLKSSEMSLEDIRWHLGDKLSYVREDSYSDGGEEGLYSLKRALSNDRLTESRGHGFFREDAALAIIFIADENDICAEYPEGVTPVYDPQRIEPKAFARDCGSVTSQGVVNQLKTLQGDRPLLVGAIVYNQLGAYPIDGENEYGYGYLDAVQYANGISVDLANPHYQQGLSEIGLLASIKLQLITEVTLTHQDIDESTIEVKVDQVFSEFDYVSENRQVQLHEPGEALSLVEIRYCLKQDSGSDSGSEDPNSGDDDSSPGSDGSEGGGAGETEEPPCEGIGCGVIGI